MHKKILEIQGSERYKGIIALLLLAITWGILPLIPRYLSTSFDLLQQVYLRMFFGFVISIIFFQKDLDYKKIKTAPLKDWMFLAGRAFIYYLVGVVLYTQSLLLTKISNVAFIGAIPMTAVLGFFLLKEKATLQKISLILLSFLGIVIISVQDFTNIFNFGLGELFALLSVIFVSLGFISRKFQSNTFNDKETATIMLFFATVFIFIASVLKGEGLPLDNWSTGIMLAILLGGLLNTSVSFFMNYGMQRVESTLANNMVALDPVFAAFFAFLVFGELPIPKEVLGSTAIIISALLMNKLDNKREKKS